MKKQFTLLVMLMLGVTVFAQEIIVEWNFPDEGADSIADGGIVQNLDKPIYTMGGTSNLNYKNGYTTKAAQATNWDNGAESKCWVVELDASNYGNLMLSSKLSSGGNDPGPRDFRVDYKMGEEGTWMEVPNSEITTANDWETGVFENLPLPEECSNQPQLYLRWIMTSDTSAAGTLVEPNGKLKIDDIIISGTDISSISDVAAEQLSFYPNPFNTYLNIENIHSSAVLKIYENTGRMVYQQKIMEPTSLYLGHLNAGLYLVHIFDINGTSLSSGKLLKK